MSVRKLLKKIPVLYKIATSLGGAIANVLLFLRISWRYKWALRSIFSTIYFNFHYLPFNQAIKLPILLYKPTLRKMKGEVIIKAPIRFGLIEMGRNMSGIHSNNGISWENNGGRVTFTGEAYIGSDTYISIGTNSSVTFGKKMTATAGFKFVSVKRVTIGDRVVFGWECLLTDTNFHRIIRLADGSTSAPEREITIGDHVWFAAKCNILPGVTIPDGCVFSLGTTINHLSDLHPYRTHRHNTHITHSTTDIHHDIYRLPPP